MVWEAIAFWVLGPVSVVSGYLVFRVNSMARATFLLALSFVAVGAALLLLRLDYLGIVVILMMVMEMAVMAVFMIALMMNPGGLTQMSMFHNKRVAAWLSVVMFVLLAAGIFVTPWPARAGAPPADVTAQLGTAIMQGKGFVMVVTGVLLFSTIVAAVVLAAPRGRYDRLGERLDRKPPADPMRGGIGR